MELEGYSQEWEKLRISRSESLAFLEAAPPRAAARVFVVFEAGLGVLCGAKNQLATTSEIVIKAALEHLISATEYAVYLRAMLTPQVPQATQATQAAQAPPAPWYSSLWSSLKQADQQVTPVG